MRSWCGHAPFILAGNKADLRSDQVALAKTAARCAELVSYEDAQALGNEVGAQMVLECSAKTQVGVKEVYENAMRVALNRRYNLKPGYNRTSRWSQTCRRCTQPSKEKCVCERRLVEVCRDPLIHSKD